MFAFVYGCQDDCGVESRPGGTGVGSRGAPKSSSICLISKEIPLEFTGFLGDKRQKVSQLASDLVFGVSASREGLIEKCKIRKRERHDA